MCPFSYFAKPSSRPDFSLCWADFGPLDLCLTSLLLAGNCKTLKTQNHSMQETLVPRNHLTALMLKDSQCKFLWL